MLWKRTLAVLVVALAAVPAFGQAQGGGGGGAGGGGRGNFNPAQRRQQMEDRLKEQLGASDDEWKALQPKVDKVLELQRDASPGRGMFGRGGRRGGPGGQGADQATPTPTPPSSPVQEKAQALQKVLDNKDSKPEEVKSALQAYRAARADAKQQLAKAQDDLRGLLTARQESVLVMFGMLE